MEKVEVFRTSENRVFDEEEPAKLCEEIERDHRDIIIQIQRMALKVHQSKYKELLKRPFSFLIEDIKDQLTLYEGE